MPMVTVPTTGGFVPAYLAQPDAPTPWPGVVVLHELFGLNDDIRSIAERFAAEGYLALAPDLLASGNRLTCLVRLLRDARSAEGRTVGEILACRDWLAARHDCSGRIGVAGFCLGGGFALALAARGFEASAAQYGHLPRDAERILRGSCPLVASYGGRDLTLARAAPRLERILSEAGVKHDIREYPEAGHGFMSRQEPPLWAKPGSMLLALGYVELAAEDAWGRMLAMFDEALRPADSARGL